MKSAQSYVNHLGARLQQAKLRLLRGGFSNFDEEQIIERFLSELASPDSDRVAVDIGAGDGIKSSNTYALFQKGWRGLGVEGDPSRATRLAHAYSKFKGVSACREQVTPANVVSILRRYGIEREFGLLSLDIDSYDYFVLDALLSEFRPRLIVTEINEKIPPPIRFVVKYDPDFSLQHHFFGYSIASLEELCERHSFAIIALEYNNAFLAPRELEGVEPVTAEDAYRRGYLERPDRSARFRQNSDMEVLHSLTPDDAVEFLNRFYARHAGKYELSAS